MSIKSMMKQADIRFPCFASSAPAQEPRKSPRRPVAATAANAVLANKQRPTVGQDGAPVDLPGLAQCSRWSSTLSNQAWSSADC
jgi:hypothetical protein